MPAKYEDVGNILWVQNLEAKGTLNQFGGDFSVPMYRGSSFLDPKVRIYDPFVSSFNLSNTTSFRICRTRLFTAVYEAGKVRCMCKNSRYDAA